MVICCSIWNAYLFGLQNTFQERGNFNETKNFTNTCGKVNKSPCKNTHTYMVHTNKNTYVTLRPKLLQLQHVYGQNNMASVIFSILPLLLLLLIQHFSAIAHLELVSFTHFYLCLRGSRYSDDLHKQTHIHTHIFLDFLGAASLSAPNGFIS